MSLIYEIIKALMLDYKMNNDLAAYGAALGAFTILIIISMILFFVSKLILVRIIGRIIKHTKGKWDDKLYEHKFFQVLIHFVPAIVIYSSSGFAATDLIWMPSFILGVAQIYILVVFMLAALRFMDAAHDVYNTLPYAKDRTIKGYIQLVKIVICCAGAIFLIAILVGQNPGTILAGLGAAAAVITFVFRDPILGFVASIQLMANNMVKQGDWITLPKHNIDGTIEDITLTTVKIQNWDKTITTIPTYSLVAEPMTNWIGMVESGGRRIQRSINLDMTSIKFCDKLLLGRLKKCTLLSDFFLSVTSLPLSEESSVKAITNLSLFKKYLEFYCSSHPEIHPDLTKMVRFLPSSDRGLPIEVIIFIKKQDALGFEALQAEIIDHILAIMPEFDLRVFQNPTGHFGLINGNLTLSSDLLKEEKPAASKN